MLGHWQTVQTQIRHHRTWPEIGVCTICLNYKLRVTVNETSTRSGHFPCLHSETSKCNLIAWQRQSTHQCCQCFDWIYFGNNIGQWYTWALSCLLWLIFFSVSKVLQLQKLQTDPFGKWSKISYIKISDKMVCANNADSDYDLHCLLFG